ncbi:MAG: MoaD family protein [Nitrososphaerales archaeon]
MIQIYITGHLKDYTGKKRELQVSDIGDVTELIDRLNRLFPGIKERIFDEQGVTRQFVNIFVNGENIREASKENTKLKDGDTVHILPSVAGGVNA